MAEIMKSVNTEIDETLRRWQLKMGFCSELRAAFLLKTGGRSGRVLVFNGPSTGSHGVSTLAGKSPDRSRRAASTVSCRI